MSKNKIIIMYIFSKMFFKCCGFNSNDIIKPVNNPICNGLTLNDAYEKLNTIKDPKVIDYFSFKNEFYYGLPCHIYDGDTFSVIFEYKGELIKYKCRCNGYDSPEMKPSLSNFNREHEKELAFNARNRLIELLNKHETRLIKFECLGFDKYGRLLINFWNNVDEMSINEIMIKEGHGKPYDGGTKDKW